MDIEGTEVLAVLAAADSFFPYTLVLAPAALAAGSFLPGTLVPAPAALAAGNFFPGTLVLAPACPEPSLLQSPGSARHTLKQIHFLHRSFHFQELYSPPTPVRCNPTPIQLLAIEILCSVSPDKNPEYHKN